jgi:hypothetical protein
MVFPVLESSTNISNALFSPRETTFVIVNGVGRGGIRVTMSLELIDVSLKG